MIGSCQWIIQLGRFDIAVHIMSMGSFRTAPRVGHLERMKRIYGYLMRFKTCTALSGLGQEFPTSLTSSTSNMTGPGPLTQERRNLFPTISPSRKENLSSYTLTLMQTYTTTKPMAELSQRYYTSSTRPRSTGSRRHRRLWLCKKIPRLRSKMSTQ